MGFRVVFIDCARQIPVFSSLLGVSHGKINEVKVYSKERLNSIKTSFAELELELKTDHDAIIQDLVIPAKQIWTNWNQHNEGFGYE